MAMIGFLAFSFAGMTIVNRVLEGQMLQAVDITAINSMTIFRPITVFGLFPVSVPNLSYFTVGLPRLVLWDYSFFGGDAAIFQFMLYSLTAAMSFLLFTIMIGMLYQFVSRLR